MHAAVAREWIERTDAPAAGNTRIGWYKNPDRQWKQVGPCTATLELSVPGTAVSEQFIAQRASLRGA